ncbi:uncharacterized protein [Heterodontus francisci]|uniref:uncharacterized protein n=1 Tax=Heterodontus francisci TaxID=7792 RepID=UPI00355B5AEE
MCCLLQLSLALSYFMQCTTGRVETPVYRTPGSSVFFPGVDEDQKDQVEVFRWKVSNGNIENGTRMAVLQFHAGAPKPSLIKKYIGRLDFDPANGSFVLHHLTSEDTGLYILFMNLQDKPVRTVQLRIMDKLSKPSILSNSSSLYSTVQLTCDVFGNPHEYQWQKDGGEISQHHQLINGNRSLIIPSATKGDCGTYTCIATNPIGSTQADYTLIIYGLPSKQIVIVVASIAGLMLSSVSLIVLLLLCCLKRESSQASLRHDKLLFLSLFSSNTLSFVAIFIALASWIAIKGAGPLSVVTLCLVAILLALAVTAAIAVWNSGCLCIERLRGNTGFRASLSLICSFIVMVISIVILAEEIQQSNQGCDVTILTWSILIPLLVVCITVFSIFFVIWCWRNDERNSDARNQQAQQVNGERLELNGIRPDQEPEPESSPPT